eukprot:CAMPEP_0174251206 /NCGR_PEP_ID=MMETSP0439-20130205/1106_1 /TAXON_ID=0 /ORGANISM="Stereomyxa ramosa, Strain Chinc5" /LENGTH=795 /DNA_ID=CAMNT_0015331467 /DNA_START=31 /DNA_END=2418 /DNA_ORIENTATION=-
MSKKKAKTKIITQPLESESEQQKVLEEATTNIRREAFYMKRCLDNKKLMEALKHASTMISELRTSLLSPKNYYMLYMEAFDQLRHLEAFLSEERQRGKKMSELYEVVQYAGNILPRLYLLVTVGSIYIKTKEAPAKDVLRDLVEMCRGVQHPTRGLFLRNYLSEMTKDKLPDEGNKYEGEGGRVTDSVHFILQNFTEMNKLWVRMQHQGPVRDKVRKEKERQELRLLVGKNLARLSQLEGVSSTVYSSVVLPKILEQIVNCKDQIAQQYLTEVIIQAFPDPFHLATLDFFLESCTKLQPTVDVRSLLVTMITRLCAYALRDGSEIPTGVNVFETFFGHIKVLVKEHKSMKPDDKLALHVALIDLALKAYPDQSKKYVSQVLTNAHELLNDLKEAEQDYSDKACVQHILKLLNLPLEAYNDIIALINLDHYSDIIPFLSFTHRHRMARSIINNAIENETYIGDPEYITKLFGALQPLLIDVEDMEELDDEDFEDDQNKVAALVNLFRSDNPETVFMLYASARRVFGQGGTKRIRFTLPPLVFGSLRLASLLQTQTRDDEQWNRVGKRVFKFAHETVTALARTDYKELAMRLFLQCAKAASTAKFETIAYEFLTQVFEIYENEIADSKSQFRAINEIIATLQSLSIFGEENYDTLSTKTAVHSAKLLKKPDQCRAVYMCSHLFWSDHVGHKDGKRVLECLQKALRIADACMDSSMNVRLFVEILNQYLYYFEHGNEHVAVKYLAGLIALIKTNLANMEIGEGEQPEVADYISTYYNNTLKHIKTKKLEGSRYDNVDI